MRALVGHRPIEIEVDGGITPETASEVVKAGATALVAGPAVFKSGTETAYGANITALRTAGLWARAA